MAPFCIAIQSRKKGFFTSNDSFRVGSNYKIVATSVSGDSEAAYLIGVAFSNGPRTGSISLHRLKGSGKLYKEAMENLWQTFAAEHGAVAGRRLALVNVRYDAATRNFLVYNDVRLSIRADVVEFVE